MFCLEEAATAECGPDPSTRAHQTLQKDLINPFILVIAEGVTRNHGMENPQWPCYERLRPHYLRHVGGRRKVSHTTSASYTIKRAFDLGFSQN
jgi:hypothetical protein